MHKLQTAGLLLVAISSGAGRAHAGPMFGDPAPPAAAPTPTPSAAPSSSTPPPNAPAGPQGPSEAAFPPPAKPASDSSWLIGGGLAGAYIPVVDEGIGVIGGQLFVEWRTKQFQSRFTLATLYATSKPADTIVPFIVSSWAYRITPNYAIGAAGGFGFRTTTGKTYSPSSGVSISRRDSSAVLAVVGVTPALVSVGPLELELTVFVGQDIASVSGPSSAQTLPGGYLAVSYVLPVSGGL
jgi:hypothetical protein